MKDVKNVADHLRMHQKYPATYEELVMECDNLSDFSEEDKQWFKTHLPMKTYKSAEEVIKSLGIEQEARPMVM